MDTRRVRRIARGARALKRSAAHLRDRLRFSSIAWIALALVGVAAVAILVSAISSRLDNWAPNIATESLSIALTIAVVQKIVRREETLRKAPRVNRALAHINAEFARFVDAVALDYVATHVENSRPIPRDRIALLDQWLEDQSEADRPHMPLPPDDETLREQGQEFARQIDQYDHRDRDVLEPDLVAAIRDVWGARQHSIDWERRIGHTLAPPELVDPEALSYRALVAAARAFGKVLRKYAPPVLFEIDDDTLQWVNSVRFE